MQKLPNLFSKPKKGMYHTARSKNFPQNDRCPPTLIHPNNIQERCFLLLREIVLSLRTTDTDDSDDFLNLTFITESFFQMLPHNSSILLLLLDVT